MTGRHLVMAAAADSGGQAVPDNAVVSRWGYCSQCGWTRPRFGAPEKIGTAEDVRRQLLPAFQDHHCPGSPG
jgi:hypothetical protein